MQTKKVGLKLGFIGAGCVNFGGAEGPWDHVSNKHNPKILGDLDRNLFFCIKRLNLLISLCY
jgi:hypothetical protein